MTNSPTQSIRSKRQDTTHHDGIHRTGGQGCLNFRGKGGLVKGNLFVNDQRVTNHYSLSLDSNGGEVCNNIFKPKRGSGIYIYKYRDNDVHHNEFEIVASPPIRPSRSRKAFDRGCLWFRRSWPHPGVRR